MSLDYRTRTAIADGLRSAGIDSTKNRERMQHLILDKKMSVADALEEVKKRAAKDEQTELPFLYGRIKARNQREFEKAVERRRTAYQKLKREIKSHPKLAKW